jgi:Fe-S oxidoreductase
VTEAKVRLVPVPPVKGLAAVHFADVPAAATATVAALEHAPSAVELIDDTIIERCRLSAGFRQLAGFVQGNPGALLLIEFYGDSEAEAAAKLARLESDLRGRGIGGAVVATTDPARQREMWRMREAGLGLLMSVPGDSKPIAFVEDTAVAPERLGEFVVRFKELVGARGGGQVAYYGHASVGCLHIRPMVNVKSSEGLAAMEAIAEGVADLVLEFGGSLSGEHGDGILRGVFTEKMFGPRLTGAFREVKRAFDPDGLLNPNKIVDTPAFAENLRLSPATRNVEPVTFLDFTAQGGIAGAAEQCNGQGACRKLDGTMCPSYMVTLDEEHSTRGRANLLRLAFSGVLPPGEMAGDRVHAALDLCVECKACKSECPSGVDLAKLKYEVLSQHNQAHGTPLRSRLFANIRALGRLGARAPALANTLSRLPPARLLMHRFGGIHRDRPLPALAGQRFAAWFKDRPVPAEAPRGDAIYFLDTFTDLFHPEVGIAATRVLEALGYRVRLVEQLACCGRPAISKGLLGQARSWARHNVDALLPYAAQGLTIVGTEPSCLLSLRDEYPDLLRDEASLTVAASALLIDELVAELAETEPQVRELFRPDLARQVLLHGHCHQKALVGIEPTLRMLRLVPGYTVEAIDSGCCGMAGSFGFEAEHYEVSRAMGALRLFPAVEAAAGETAIAVTGVSCRQQIGHFTSKRPRHAVELLADALV